MRFFPVSLIALALCGCAGVGSIQADCEQSTSTFKDMSACLASGVNADRRLASNQSAQLYLLKARQLSEWVDAGKITDTDARFELKNLFVRLSRQEDADTDAVLATTPKPRQTIYTNCQTSGASASCTSR